ncbi:MAG: hypothetical protein L0H84_21010 [Pseudonocardia sp.]|nr:hypothetical protein [Pseudonocardia sp.]
MTMTTSLRRTTSLRIAFPDGVASVRQLVAFGIAERTVYNRCLDGGPWQRLLPGIVLLSTGPPTEQQRAVAAVLLGGPEALITGIEACRRYGVRRGPAKVAATQVQILVPRWRQLRSVGHVHVERTGRLPLAQMRGGLPLAPIVRASNDAARQLRSAGDIAELLSDPVQRGLCTVAELAVDLDQGSRRGTAMPRAVLRELSVGARSAAEAAARRLWVAARLPDALWNVEVCNARGDVIGIADCWVDDVAMAWEIESSEWHLSPGHHTRTVERAAGFVAAGVVYTASKPSRIHKDPRSVIATLRATHRVAAARPRPAVRVGEARFR